MRRGSQVLSLIVSTWLGAAYAAEPAAGVPAEPPLGVPSAPPAGAPAEPAAGVPIEPPSGAPSAPPAGAPAERAAGMPAEPAAGVPIEPPPGVPSAPAAGAPTEPAQPASPPGGTERGPENPPVAAPLTGFAQARFDQLALRREGEGFWIVTDGTGHPLDLEEWASRTGDRAPLQLAWRRQAVQEAWLARIGGTLLLGAGVAGLLAIPPLDEVGAFQTSAKRTNNQATTALCAVVTAAGFGLVVVSFSEPSPSRRRHPDLSAWMTSAAADTVIGGYNEQLRLDLAGVGTPAPPR